MKNTRFLFVALTILLGILFPIGATILQTTVANGLPLTWENFRFTHISEPMLWIVDTSPIFLGIYAFFAGTNLERYQRTAADLETQIVSTQELAEQLRQQNINLEAVVQERTATIDKRASYLEAAAEVGRAATSIYNMEDLLPQVTQFVSERFDFYQVGIFLLDEIGEYAVMQAASSEGGKRMLARNHKLKVGEEGIVGYVTKTGEVRIALDVGADAVHFDNPELPETRSEMALPLFSGGRIFGALDVQSIQPSAFSEDDIFTLRVLADQVSMAINNALLFEQLQDSVEAERRAFGEVSRTAWRSLIQHSSGVLGYRLRDKDIITARGSWAPEMTEAAQTAHTIARDINGQPVLALPVTVSNEVIGAVRLCKPSGANSWTDDEIELMQTLTERLSQALEAARLYQETQQRAAQEQLTAEVTTKIRQSLDIDHVLRTAVQEFAEVFEAEEVIFRITPLEDEETTR